MDPRKPQSCAGCPLAERGLGFVPPVIPGVGGLMLVGEAPGETEARAGTPFIGPAGIYLDRLLKRAGIERDAVAVTNVLACRPPNNELRGESWAADAIDRCSVHLRSAIDRAAPRVLVALGDTALAALTGTRGIQRYRGAWQLGPRAIPTIATFHPSYLLPGRTRDELKKDRPTRFTGIAILDLLKARAQTARPRFERLPTRYRLDPEPGGAADFVREYENALANRGPEVLLTYDIETPGKGPRPEQQLPMLEQPIARLSFAWEPGYAMTVPHTPRYLELVRRLLATTGGTTGWNSFGFDNPILEATHGRIARGPHYDMMRGWHVLQSDLPKDLEFVSNVFTDLLPWKHLSGLDQPLYSATDSDAQIRISYGVREALQPYGQWDVFVRLLMEIAPFLRTAGRRGLPIDQVAQAALEEALSRKLSERLIEAQPLVPDDLKARKIYQRPPKNRPSVEVSQIQIVKVCTCGADRPSVVHYRDTKTRPACPGTPVLEPRESRVYEVLLELEPEMPLAVARARIAECGFNPLSVPQVTAYAERFRHLALLRASGLRFEGLDDTTLGYLVKRFGKAHPIYGLVRDIRIENKELGTYVIGYRPDARGRIVTTYNDNPSTLRLGSQDVNTQNVKDDIKRTIRAPRGWCFVEVDSSAIEALMVGLCAQSARYVRLAAAGVHDFVLAAALGIPWDADALAITKAKENKPLRDVKKMTVHLSNFGGTPGTMRRQAPTVYLSESMAAREQAFYFEVCPEIREWQSRTQLMAAKTNIVRNPWGFPQYFYGVFDGDKKGPDWSRCLGAGPQSMAAFVMRENLWRLKDSEWAQYACANVTTHDSLALLVPDALARPSAEGLLALMTRPIEQLDNLRVGAEAKLSWPGGTWSDMSLYRTIRFEDPLELSRWAA